jgi:hypothetical protein
MINLLALDFHRLSVVHPAVQAVMRAFSFAHTGWLSGAPADLFAKTICRRARQQMARRGMQRATACGRNNMAGSSG